ncbi:hypothetical protein AGMMS50293_14740 [Spirochaetia bacterium]|nr:hypothetical protein AGMMS50293_14740 [Spirochaetia bacterium]
MAEQDLANYNDTLLQTLLARKDWLEKSELVRMKDELRVYQSAFASLYHIYLKKKLINEDPYKQETKISELEVPETGTFIEAKRVEQLSIRLANYDNQLDFLVNFYQFGVDFLNLERIKRILGLVRYVDWINLSPDSQSHNTKAVAEITLQSKAGVDQIALSVIGESLTRLTKATTSVIAILKDLTAYYKESYKLNVRNAVTRGMSAADANTANIKKKFAAALPGTPFYQEFIEEIIREDYSKDGPAMKEAILKSLKLEDEKPKAAKPAVNFKATLMEGIQVIGGTNVTFSEIGAKIDENEAILENQKNGFWDKVRKLIKQMTNSEPDEVIYELQYMDPTKGVPVKEKINVHQFRGDMDKKAKILGNLTSGPATTKLSAMAEEQIITYLERNIRDVQFLHRTLSALDDYFKSKAPPAEREKIRGIKPELATIKNCIVRANQLRHEYSAQKEEEEQMKRLGISPGA